MQKYIYNRTQYLSENVVNGEYVGVILSNGNNYEILTVRLKDGLTDINTFSFKTVYGENNRPTTENKRLSLKASFDAEELKYDYLKLKFFLGKAEFFLEQEEIAFNAMNLELKEEFNILEVLENESGKKAMIFSLKYEKPKDQ